MARGDYHRRLARVRASPRGQGDLGQKRLAACVSLAGGLLVLALKGGAFFATGSSAILSDALESTVNLIAAGLLLWSIALAARPADPTHPYGHGKAELFSAAAEGAMIAVAAATILLQAGRALWVGPELRQLDLGLALICGAAVINAALGLYLVAVGRRTESLALVADGRHVLSDVWTSAGVLVGLLAARVSGWLWLDPLTAIAVAAHLAYVAAAITWRAAQGLMDSAERATLERIADALEESRRPGWVDVHSLRAWRSGDLHHVDLHLVAPRFLSVEELHRISEALESSVLERAGLGGEVIVHFDPCRPRDCASCAFPECPVRSQPFAKRERFTPERATREDLPI
jgi:cation diffusion facilitator family transporter